MTGDQVLDWFRALEGCVARVDYESAADLFAEDAVGFGTKASLAVGRETLRENQWSGIWPNIRDFHFNFDTLHHDSDGDLTWAVVTWGSTGFHEDGAGYDRPGRATVVFRRQGEQWRAVHTHFSLFPGTPGRTFGPR